jgi:sulfur dioxygenase
MRVLCLDPGASCKTWALVNDASREAVLVDPVLQRAQADLERLEREGLRIAMVVDTHTHADHVSGATFLARKLGVPYAMHSGSGVATVTERIRDGERLRAAGLDLRVIHTPGHTKDSVCLLGEGHLLTGDFLFLGEGGAGRTDLLGGDPGEHWDSLRKLSGLPDATWVHPGHDYRGGLTGRLGEERARNPRLAARSREEYVRWLEGFQLGPADWMVDVVQANLRGAVDAHGVSIPEGGACCEVAAGADQGPSVAPEELARLLAMQSPPPLVWDVREPAEFTGPLGHVPGARNLPLSTLARELPGLAGFSDCEIYLICLSGSRSGRAAQLLREHGFRKAVSVLGGTRAWAAAGLPRHIEHPS